MGVKEELKEGGLEILRKVKEIGHRRTFEEEYALHDFNDLLTLHKYVYFCGKVLVVDMTKYLTEVTSSEDKHVKRIVDMFSIQISTIIRCINECNLFAGYAGLFSADMLAQIIQYEQACIVKFNQIIDAVSPIMNYLSIHDVELDSEEAVVTDCKEFGLAYQSLIEKGGNNE